MDATETTHEDSSTGDDGVMAVSGTVGGDSIAAEKPIEEDTLKNYTTIHNVDDVEESTSFLERKVEAIDDEEAAITPTLQRNAPFSTPGAFRASPHCGVLRRVEGGTTGGSVTNSMITSLSRAVSGGGDIIRAAAPPPIEAVLVENSSTVRDQRRRRRRRRGNNNNHQEDDDDDDDDVFTAEPLASVKEFVSTTPRYIIIFLATLCIVTVITSTAAIGVVVADKMRNEEETLSPSGEKSTSENQNYYSHHAVIFGSNIVSTNESYPSGCPDDSIEIRITCNAGSSLLQVYEDQIGEYANCQGKTTRSEDFYEHYHCTVPYSLTSYISFDCLTPYPVKAQDTTATVTLYQQVNTTCENRNRLANTTTDDNDSLAFLRLVRICGPDLDNIITVYNCDDENSGMTNSQLEACTKSLNELGVNSSTENIMDPDVLSDCNDDNGSCSLRVVDRSRCPMNDPPEQEKLDSDDLEPMLKENVTALINLFLTKQ